MVFKWHEFLTLAEELSQRKEEASQRTAISRAYYFVFHLARQRLIENGFEFGRGGGAHQQVWEKFQNDDERCRKLNELGMQLLDKRKQADYDNPYPSRIESEVSAILERARKFAADLEALDKALPKNRTISGKR